MTYFPRLLGQGVWKSLVKHRKTTSKVSSKYWSKVPAEQTPCYWVLYGCKKKSQKVQLSMSLCASASTLYFGKFWYWCIILDHLPNVVYIYIPNILNLADRPSIDPMPILALALILSICGSLHPPVALTQSIQENQHLHSQLTWC